MKIDDEHVLPCDFIVGHMRFRKGVKLETVRGAAERSARRRSRSRSSVALKARRALMGIANLELKTPGELLSEITRLRDALFKIQCEQLDRGTDTARSAKSHRDKCMATRDRIIAILSASQ